MSLQFLIFDYSEDTQGVGTLDAMASVAPAQLPAVHAEVAQVLAWALEAFGDSRGAVADGGQWDYDLQGQAEYTACESLAFDEGAGRVVSRAGSPSVVRHTVSLSISGDEVFCQAFRSRFDVEAY